MDGIIMLSNMQDDIFSLGHASPFCCAWFLYVQMVHKSGAKLMILLGKKLYKARDNSPVNQHSNGK